MPQNLENPRAKIRLAWLFAAATLLVVASPAQAGIAFVALDQDQTWTVYYQDTPDAPPRPIPKPIQGDASAPSLSPDNQTIVFEIQSAGLYTCPVQTDQDCAKLPLPAGDGARPTWWDNTGQIAYAHYRTDANGEDSELYLIDPARQIVTPLITQTGSLDYPDLSPNRRYLAYTVSGTVGLRRGGVQVTQSLWRMDLSTGKARQLLLSDAQDLHPAWSPNGQSLAFASNRSGQFEIWITDAEGAHPQLLTSGPNGKMWPTWSPDGQTILYTHLEDGRHQLWMIDADGSNPRRYQPFGPGSNKELRDADWR
ncbi:MAG: PD40 domain-containing protein [Candidatus Competibacteraceae bacterium]|nr:PD40 domain-containing protein [Candidatus Competibacteraceae bacterium]MCP5125882.1 PD40 domain-containing protein [Gammaproteobacteria bacterium]